MEFQISDSGGRGGRGRTAASWELVAGGGRDLMGERQNKLFSIFTSAVNKGGCDTLMIQI